MECTEYNSLYNSRYGITRNFLNELNLNLSEFIFPCFFFCICKFTIMRLLMVTGSVISIKEN